MLSFATEFPVSSDSSVDDFLAVTKEWVLGSPHSPFDEHDLADVTNVGEWSLGKESERIEVLTVSGTDGIHSGFRRISVERTGEREIEWITEIIFRKDESAWVSVRTARESNSPVYQLPPAKPPIVVKQLLAVLGGAHDGDLLVASHPHVLGNDDIDLATRLILGDGGCYLPVVYVSSGFGGLRTIDPGALASDLAGLAHVVAEPNRAFSTRLQINVSSENVYGGVVGIYWPEGLARRSFFLPRDYANETQLKHAIRDDIRSALLNRRPLHDVTWAAVREAQSRSMYAELRASGSVEVDKYVAAFDSELKAKDRRINDAEREISRLRRELSLRRPTEGPGAAISISIGNERDFYKGEIAAVIYDAIRDAGSRVQNGGRRQHILQAAIASNNGNSNCEPLKNKLKDALREYKSMDKSTRDTLEDLGFTITDDGKHYKIIYRDDDRYTFPLAKTGGDHRGGLNSYSDISKRIF